MELSIFLAKIIGLYLIIDGVSALINLKKLLELSKNFSENPALIFFSGFIHLLLGLLVIVSHNFWTADWRVIITLMGWLGLIKGIIRINAPYKVADFTKKFNRQKLVLISSVLIALGFYLAWVGFTL